MRRVRNLIVPGLLATAIAATMGLLVGPIVSTACDAPVHVLARSQNWARGPFTLLVAYQPGLADPKAFQKTMDEAALAPKEDDSPIAALNLTSWTQDITGPISWDYQDILDNAGVKAFPMLALLDAKGKVMEKFQSLPEARARLTPVAAGEVVSYSMRKIVLKEKPARLVIVYDSKASIDLDSPIASTQPERNRVGIISSSSTKVLRVPTLQIAERWVKELAAEPLAGLGKADLVDLSDAGKDAGVIEALRLRTLPVCLLIDSLNRTVAVLDKIPGKDELRRIAHSPTRDQIIKLLNSPKATMCLISIRGKNTKTNAQADAAIAKALELAKQTVTVFKVDGSDPAEEYLLRQFDFKPGQDDPMIVPVFGQGKVLDPITVDKKKTIDPASVLDAVQFVFNNGCRDIPVGFDLLLGASDKLPADARKWTPTTMPEAKPAAPQEKE
ncbi:MAG: hypothetical protein PHU85_02140 [Phycisphaerae bacterium]|nr:hypothetical protein [Phycisphaerae bacterium]